MFEFGFSVCRTVFSGPGSLLEPFFSAARVFVAVWALAVIRASMAPLSAEPMVNTFLLESGVMIELSFSLVLITFPE